VTPASAGEVRPFLVGKGLQVEIVYNGRVKSWQFLGAPHATGYLGRPGTAYVKSDPLCMNRLADRALPAASHTGRAEMWQKVAVFETYFERMSTGVRGLGWNLDMSHWSRILHP
jgi:hypothetical protein